MGKTFFVVLLALILGGVGGFFAYKSITNSQNSQNKASKNKDLKSYSEPFQWGVTMRPNALGNYQPEIWQRQIKRATALGVGWARIGWDYENADPFKRNDDVINALTNNGIQTLLVIEQDPKQEGKVDNYKDGYDDGFKIAGHYKGKIKFYQMINEGGATSIKAPTMSGQTADQYDDEKYKNVTEYLKGLSDGIAKADPDAWRIVSISFTHTGFIDRLISDNIKFDMIGIDWYDWMGPINEKKMDDGQMFTDKLKSYNKPLSFMEVNAVPSGVTKNSKSKKIVDENAQSDMISQTGQWACANRDYVKGFYVLELIDNANNPNDNAEYFGIISAEKATGGTYIPGEPRKAYNTYQNLIKSCLTK